MGPGRYRGGCRDAVTNSNGNRNGYGHLQHPYSANTTYGQADPQCKA